MKSILSANLPMTILACLIAAACLTGNLAFSAEMTLSHSIGCKIELRGEITEGDANRFSAIVTKYSVGRGNESSGGGIISDHTLCLDSRGGSIDEGKIIAKLIHDVGITTRIPAYSECFSTCAFIFMAGRNLTLEEDGQSRYMDINAKLGFHAPFFPVRDDQYFSGSDLKKLVRLSQDVLGDLVLFNSFVSEFDTRPMISLSLLGELLHAGPSELVEVSSVEDASRWRVSLEGVAEKRFFSQIMLVQACVNFQEWAVDKKSETISTLDYYFDHSKDFVSEGEALSYIYINTGGMADRHCFVEKPKSASDGVRICSTDDFNGLTLGDCSRDITFFVPWYQALPPSTKLVDLAP